MVNIFKKPPHTRMGYEEAEKILKEAEKEKEFREYADQMEKKFYDSFNVRAPSVQSAKRKLRDLKKRGHEEALDLENQYHKLLEDLEEARKAGWDIEDIRKKEDEIYEFETRELGKNPSRPRLPKGPYR